jgi:hypothetical protein
MQMRQVPESVPLIAGVDSLALTVSTLWSGSWTCNAYLRQFRVASTCISGVNLEVICEKTHDSILPSRKQRR